MEKKLQRAHYLTSTAAKSGETPILVAGDYEKDCADYESMLASKGARSILDFFL